MPISLLRLALPIAVALSPAALLAERVEYTGGGSIVGNDGTPPPELSPETGPYVSFSFVFDTEQEPITSTDTAATYAAVSASVTIANSAPRPLTNATIMVVRAPADGDYIYLLEGTTAQGWIVTYFVDSRNPEFVPTLALPVEQPVHDDDYSASIEVRQGSREWTAYSDSTDLFSVHATPPENGAPVITSQPEDAVRSWGSSVTFTIATKSTSPVRYQWYKDGRPLHGANNASLKLWLLLPFHAGEYHVVARNENGSVTSETAKLTLKVAPFIVQQPNSLTIKRGGTATFSVRVTSSSEPVNYQWYKDGTALNGANGRTLTLPEVSRRHAGQYRVEVSNAFGRLTSSSARLAVR